MMKRSDSLTQRGQNSSSGTDTNHVDAKKARIDGASLGDSCVLHIRGLPSEVSDYDVAALAIPFGTLSNLILTKKNGQALVEMDTLESTHAMYNYYTKVYCPSIRGRNSIEIQFSKYSSLTKPNTNQQTVNAIQDANRQYTNFHMENDGASKTILHIQVEHALPHTDLGYLPFYNCFRRFGQIKRVISFKKGDSRHAFLEFEDSTAAHVAKLQMNGKPLFPGDDMCILRTEFSRQATLEVHREDNYSRDFTRNPWNEMTESGDPFMGPNGGPMNRYPKCPPMKCELDLLTEERLAAMDPPYLSALAYRLIKPLLKVASTIQHPQADILRAQANTLAGLSAFIADHAHAGNFDNYNSWSGMGSISSGPDDNYRPTRQNLNSPVVFVSNLNTERVNPDTLFILFGVYGDVQRVKIIHNNKNTALVQFTDTHQAHRAVNYLNGVTLYGKTLRCVISKNVSVTLPQNTDSESENKNTCDYSGHRLHRFRRANSRNHHNICPPSTVLHVSNIPDEMDEDSLTSVFEHVTRSHIKQIRLFGTDKKMALVQFDDLDQTVSALIAMHDYPIEENVRLRVSFSKSVI